MREETRPHPWGQQVDPSFRYFFFLSSLSFLSFSSCIFIFSNIIIKRNLWLICNLHHSRKWSCWSLPPTFFLPRFHLMVNISPLSIFHYFSLFFDEWLILNIRFSLQFKSEQFHSRKLDGIVCWWFWTRDWLQEVLLVCSSSFFLLIFWFKLNMGHINN